jgi:hypothetical protein
LFCGWRTEVADMATELDEYVGPGSELVILSNVPVPLREKVFQRKLGRGLRNIRISHIVSVRPSDLVISITNGILTGRRVTQ